MKSVVYSNKLLVTDLIVTSIWALFAAKCTPDIESWELVAILIRIALCFRMYAKSDWMGYSAMVFAGAYLMLPNHFAFGFQHAVTGIIYYTLHIIVWDIANDTFLHLDRIGFNVAYYVLWLLLSIWLVLIPLIVSISCKKLFKFPRWCWIILVLFYVHVILGICGFVSVWYRTSAICFAAVCLLPDIYWVVRYGRKQSLVYILTANRPLMFYGAFVALFLAAIVIGVRNLYILRFIGFLTFPPIFYVLLAKSVGTRRIPTYDTVFVSVCGAGYWFCSGLGQTPKIICLSVAVLICLVVGIRLIRQSSSIFAGLFLFIGTTGILCPAMYGMNPYVVTDAKHYRLYMKKPGAYNGLYVIDNYDGVCGLRSRYCEILPMKYSTFDILNDSDENILCCKERVNDDESDSSYLWKYTFFNINRREFIQIPENISITKIKPVRKGVYKLYDNTDTARFYLVMPFTDDIGHYQSEVQILECADEIVGYNVINTDFPDDAIKLESPDCKIKFYSWDTGMGGTNSDYASDIEYYDGKEMVLDSFNPFTSSEYVCGKDIANIAVSHHDGSAASGFYSKRFCLSECLNLNQIKCYEV